MKVQKRKFITTIIILSISILIILFAPIIKPNLHKFLFNKCDVIIARDSLIVHFVSVGNADAMAINLPDGKTMLIDTGTNDTAVTYSNYIDDYVLSRFNKNTLDYVVLTHADNDHSGGLLRIMKNYEIGTLFIPNLDGSSLDYINAKTYWENNDIVTEYHTDGKIISNDLYEIKFFGPLSETTTNNNSPLIKISYRGYSILFTGDISSTVEAEFVAQYGDELDCDVLKVAHHGSKYSTSIDFLNVVTPTISVISCGKNQYGHPTDTVLNNLKSINSSILRTDNNGNIAVVVNDLGVNYKTYSYTISNVIDYRIYLLIIDVVIIADSIIAFVRIKKLNRSGNNTK